MKCGGAKKMGHKGPMRRFNPVGIQGNGPYMAPVDAQGDAMRKQKKLTQRKKYTPKDEQAKERERMAEALAAYQGPITKCPPGSVEDPALSASARMAKRPSRVR